MKMRKIMALLGVMLFVAGIGGCATGEVMEAEIAVVHEADTASEESEETPEVTEAVQEVEETPEAAEAVQEAEEAQEVSETETMEHGEIISISMAEMKEKLAAKEDFLVSFVTINCPYCQEYHEILVDYIQEHKIIMYQVILDYEELPEQENRQIIKEYFNEFSTVPGTFYVENGENASYLDMYNLGVTMEVLDHWVQELGIEQQ